MPTHRRRSTGATRPVTNHSGGFYEIKIQGHLDEHWLDWFEGLTSRYVRDRNTGLDITELRGMFSDQPALHGVLTKIRDLNLTLISVAKLPAASPSTQERSPQGRQSRTRSH